ncbi:MAG: signal recognition particle-docking protein FtsY, partial [Aquificaceae bacterium]
MFRIFKKKKPQEKVIKEPIVEEVIEQVEEKPVAEAVIVTPEPQVDEIAKEQPLNVEKPKSKTKKVGLFSRLKQGLSRTGSSLTEGVSTVVLGKKQIDDDVLEELETRLLVADVGMEATMKIIDQLTEKVKRKELENIDALMQAMHKVMIEILHPVSTPLEIKDEHHPTVILMVGINGAGKTTTIGKLAKQYQKQGKSVMLAAGDTFRAAAV